MSSLDQYLELWRDHRSLIERNSSGPLNRLREEAAEVLSKIGLPRQGTADYPHTDLEKELAPDYGLNLARVPMETSPAASFRCEVPRLTTDLFFMANDIFQELSEKRLPDGVRVKSLALEARENPEFVERYYGGLADISNPLVALDTLFCQDGMVLHVSKGVKVEKPIQLVNILHSLVPYMAVRRILIVMEEESEVSVLVCDHTQVPEIDLLTLQTIEIYAGRGSKIDYYDLEESTETTTRLSTLWVRQEEGSRVLLDGITLFNGKTRNEYYVRLAGRHSELRLLGMAIEDGDRKQESFSRIYHDSPDCKTDELFKYVVDDRATGSFIGRIVVAPGSTGTEAYQSNRNLVGSDSSRMHSKPELEIYNDDVKCSHGSATGQLDAMQLFYMRTRGLSDSESRLLLKQAFMSDVIDAVSLPMLSERLHHLVEMRFSGALTSGCGVCHGCGSAG